MRQDYKKVCFFCKNKNIEIDYRDVSSLKKHLNFTGQIVSRSRTGNCAKHQRKIAKAIKTARQMALLSSNKV